MLFFKAKNDLLEFLSLEEYKKNIDNLILSDDCISRKEYITFLMQTRKYLKNYL